jgi:transcriptional regulator with AAA-type ATPase domain
MEALRFSGRHPDAVATRTGLEGSAALTKARFAEPVAAFVVRNRDLETLREFDGVVDRGRKHPRKPLAKLLLGHDRIPLVAGSYRSPGQIVRSVGDLLRNARKANDRNVYVIGVDADLFKTLWAKSRSDGARHAATTEAPGWCQAIIELPGAEVPPEIERRFVGTSRMAQLVRQQIVRAAATSEDVLILGDTGTGKEVVAHCIHQIARRYPFVPVNCASYSGDQLEAVLFGREGAPGLWQQAGSGMLFLDEIGGLRSDHQARIMRALEERRIRPRGARRDVPVPARVLASSNRDLFALMQADQFLSDLYYRLRAFTISIPPLRTRPEDIAPLAQSLWKGIVSDEAASLPSEITAALRSYGWPGNVRELKSVLASMHALFGNRELRVAYLRAELQRAQSAFGGPLADGRGARQLEMLRHLRHVDEVIRACEMTVRPLFGKRPSASAVAAAHAGMHYRLHELDILCGQSLLFGDEKTFMRVYELKAKLVYFHDSLEFDVQEAVRYWRSRVEGEMEGALAAVVKAEGRVVRAL